MIDLDIDLDTLTIGEARRIAGQLAPLLGAAPASTAHPYAPIVGRHVIVRSHLSGVWWGVLSAVHGTSGVTLTGARRIHYWTGAGSCSGLALRGPTGGRICGAVSEVAIPETVEILTTTPEADSVLAALPVWSGQ